jgi:flagella basal body P-ring formation protein FlgA
MLRDYLLGLVVLVATSSVSAADMAVMLRSDGLVRGDNVTVGDVFDNAGAYAERILAPAPEVGKPMVLEHRDLERIVRAFNMEWTNEDRDASITLERDAFVIDHTLITEALAASDLQDRISSDARFTITSPEQGVVLNGRAVPEIHVHDVSFDPTTERFSATLTVGRNGTTLKEIAVSGVATPLVSVPALTHPVPASVLVSKADIIDVLVPRKTLRSGTILRADDLAGMTLKRSVKANTPITTSDVTPPLMVKRNELVTVTYRNGPITLSTKARALGNAVRGDTVMLININSKKEFEAMMTGPLQAEVQLNGLNG